MAPLLFSITALLVSVFILLVGHGLQLTVAPLYAAELGWHVSLIGYTGSAYFLGFVIGCLMVPRLVTRVGHIRAFAVLSAAATAALLGLALMEEPAAWMVARLITGWCMAGIYMVIESWLNERTSPANRGFILSIYTVLSLGALCLGQLLIGTGLNIMQLVMLGAVLLAIGSIPIGLTVSPAPSPIPVAGFKLREVYREAHVAVFGALVGGLVTSGFWVLGPIFAKALLLTDEQVGYFLALTLLGGALFQLPVGKLSDHYDRRKVLAGLSIFGLLVCVAAYQFASESVLWVLVFMFLFGATSFPIYSISLAHANDNTSLSLIETGSVILMLHAAGSIVGPIALAAIMDYTNLGLFAFSGAIHLIFAVWAIFRIRTHTVKREHFEPFQDVPRTTQQVMELTTHEEDDQNIAA